MHLQKVAPFEYAVALFDSIHLDYGFIESNVFNLPTPTWSMTFADASNTFSPRAHARERERVREPKTLKDKSDNLKYSDKKDIIYMYISIVYKLV